MDFSSKIATYTGLNEAVFLDRLDVLLDWGLFVEVKEVDDILWVCLTLDQLVTEFPFWDKSQIKRIIKNVREDGLLRSRYDLNEDPKDNSAWHTINYTELSQLNGKVERLLKKNTKRRKARAQRQIDEQPGYIYFCKTDAPGVKIGATKDVDLRMKQLNAKLLLSFPVANMAKTENEIHAKCKGARIKGEQFDIPTLGDINQIARPFIKTNDNVFLR